MPSLTKRELVMRISRDTGIIQHKACSIIEKTMELITDALASGRNVELRNFGVFEVRLTKPRLGRNPKKPEQEVIIPVRATVKFKSGKAMTKAVRRLPSNEK